MKAYKFLAGGAMGPLSGFGWPVPEDAAPGAWVDVEGALEVCARGSHVCRPTDLAYWLHDELWELEADGDWIEGIDCLVVRRARLVRRVDAWQQGGAARFADACVRRATEIASQAGDDAFEGAGSIVRGYLDDATSAAGSGFAAFAAFASALAAARAGAPEDEEACYRRERAWQSAWIANDLLSV
jgi:hypothetical protein